ncbi:MAG TPA: single-stranded DNA-binding protein [Acidimicrobiia bacterium]
MTAKTPPSTSSHVDLLGRLGAHVRSRELPSGDELTSFTVIVDRPVRERRGGTKVDAIACTTTNRKIRDRLQRLEPGTQVEVEGVLRRRFWRAGASAGQVGSTTEVLVRNLRVV